MPAIEIHPGAAVTPGEGYRGTGHRTKGSVEARRVSPDGYSLWLVTADLGNGAIVELPSHHGDEAVFVVEGGISVGDRVVPARGAIIAESDVPLQMTAVGPTKIVHFGPSSPVPPTDGRYGPVEPEGHRLHLVGPRGHWSFRDAEGECGHYFTDGSCPTCRISLHIMYHGPKYEQEAHSHSQDELLHVVSGSIRVGRRFVGPGDTLSIDAHTRYRFWPGPEGFEVLNYRRDASEMSFPDGRPILPEGAEANDLELVADSV